ncbi:putative aminomethyltransferase mitochondrial precursor [Papiliotrema laurentii]|uniref:Aminomethyltransferase n=1 Tax=Papiliotrema laurentii TaxID=5418 RepID=A0AAD9FQ92_PAPLA|nr:putative aminomethyltransferase mitochondrial precursor [Papiliotrema laurentii]
MFSRSARVIARSPLAGRVARVPSAPLRTFASTPRSLQELLKTPLYEYNVGKEAKMVPFAGYSMPLSYGSIGQTTAHNHVRTAAGLFDVSHMLQHTFKGPGAQDFLLSLTPSSLASLTPFTSTLSVILNDLGGIIDDTIITKQEGDDSFYIVTNAGRIKEDKELISKKLAEWKGKEVKWETLDGYGLVALQGPKAAETLQKLVDVDLSSVKFGQSTFAHVGENKVKCHLARGGYTGEDGFEISIPPADAVSVTEQLVASPDVMLIGLGARDSLRLEAGMCLYGHDLDESISPVEAGLSWVIGKDRRSEDAPAFPGRSRILKELKEGPRRRRVGFVVDGAPAREGCLVFDAEGSQQIGVITSGIPSPTLGKNIAMGYVANGQHKKGTQVQVEVRKKRRNATVTPMPFVPSKYFK